MPRWCICPRTHALPHVQLSSRLSSFLLSPERSPSHSAAPCCHSVLLGAPVSALWPIPRLAPGSIKGRDGNCWEKRLPACGPGRASRNRFSASEALRQPEAGLASAFIQSGWNADAQLSLGRPEDMGVFAQKRWLRSLKRIMATTSTPTSLRVPPPPHPEDLIIAQKVWKIKWPWWTRAWRGAYVPPT